MKKDIDKYCEENKEEVNKSYLLRGCGATIKIDRLEFYHSNSTAMNMEDFSNRYFEPKGKSSNEEGISFIQGRVIRDNLIVNADYSTTKDIYLDAKADIYLNVYPPDYEHFTDDDPIDLKEVEKDNLGIERETPIPLGIHISDIW